MLSLSSCDESWAGKYRNCVTEKAWQKIFFLYLNARIYETLNRTFDRIFSDIIHYVRVRTDGRQKHYCTTSCFRAYSVCILYFDYWVTDFFYCIMRLWKITTKNIVVSFITHRKRTAFTSMCFIIKNFSSFSS